MKEIMFKSIFDVLLLFVSKYCLVEGWGEVITLADGKKSFDCQDHNHMGFAVLAGSFEEDLIQSTLYGYEPQIESGRYKFKTLLSHSPTQTGNYPPPNIEVEEYMLIEYIEYEKES